MMDINSDMGEINRLLDDGTYEKLMNYVTSINVACGGHAGDETMMAAMVALAKEKGVNVGAHPSYPDKENFGRIDIDMDQNELLHSVRDQIQLLSGYWCRKQCRTHPCKTPRRTLQPSRQ